MTTFGWIRHGETEWNLEGRIQGQTDIPLNEAGRAQARAAAERLRSEPAWDVLYASDLSRALETAKTIGAAIGLPVAEDERLREMSFGMMEGTTLPERLARYGTGWDTHDPAAESGEDVAARGTAFVRDALARHPGRRVLIVSHGALIARTLTALAPDEIWTEKLGNTSMTVMRLADGAWRRDLYNCTKHLSADV